MSAPVRLRLRRGAVGPDHKTATRTRNLPAGGLGRASGVMALGTVASRVTGFTRTIAIVAALGTHGLADAYNVANVTPNILYDLLLGGVLSSAVVPVLARATDEDTDGGDGLALTLLTTVALGLGVIALIGVLAAPLVVDLYLARGGAEHDAAVTFTRFFLPQVAFYGVGAAAGAVLNVRGRFGAPMLAPVLNNVIVTAAALTFIVLPGPRPPTATGLTTAQTLVLGLGTTGGVVAMTLALLPSLRRSGLPLRPRFDLGHPGLRLAVRLGGWVFGYALTNQLGFFVITRLATRVSGFSTYSYAYQLFQLPHAIIAVSVITALLPRMSRHAAQQRLRLVSADLALGTRIAAAVLVPASLGLAVLARPVAVTAFAHGATSVADARLVGSTLAAFALGLVPFSLFQLQLRAFYALADSRTPTLINLIVTAVNVALDLVLAASLPQGDVVVGLAAGFGASYAVGVGLNLSVLRRRLGGVGGASVLQLLVRTVIAATIATSVAGLLALGVETVAGGAPLGAAVALVVAIPVGAAAYRWLCARMRVREVDRLTAVVRARLGR